MPYLSLTTWSLHRLLGPMRMTRWDEAGKQHVLELADQPASLDLLELPALLADKGFQAMDICHFHFPNTDEAYLKQLKARIADAGLRFYTLLIDYGDISNPDPVRRSADIRWIKRWIDAASAAGAERVRIIGGDADPDDRGAVGRSVEALRELIAYAAPLGVRVITENFRRMNSTADTCLSLLDACGSGLGLVSDFGNFKGPDKYEELSKIIPRSESIHAKAVEGADGILDRSEFEKCMALVKDTEYEGPITLVYDGPQEMWEGIRKVRELVTPYLT